MIETKGCDSGRVGSAPLSVVCFQWNLGELIQSLPLTQNLSTLSVFSIERKDSCHQLRVCKHSTLSLLTNASWTACLLTTGEEGSGTGVLGFVLRIENMIPPLNLPPGTLLVFLSFLQFSTPQHLNFSPIPSKPPRSGEEEKGSLSPSPLWSPIILSPLNQMQEQDYSDWCKLSRSYAVLQVAD